VVSDAFGKKAARRNGACRPKSKRSSVSLARFQSSARDLYQNWLRSSRCCVSEARVATLLQSMRQRVVGYLLLYPNEMTVRKSTSASKEQRVVVSITIRRAEK
jgi:hypothetical protein